MQLLTIPFSHYNERARWALQHHGVAALERRYLPMLHLRAVRAVVPRAQRVADKVGSGLSTPVLVLDDGRVLNDSSEIVQWADATRGTEASSLYPADQRAEILALEQRLHDSAGRDTRFMAYWYLLDDADALAALVRANVSWWQRAVFTLGASAARSGMRRRLGLTSARHRKVRERLMTTLGDLGALLGDRSYYVGDRFSAADLTAAALLSPVLHPIPRFGAQLPRLEGPFQEFRAEVASTAAGQHALRMFAEHRGDPPPGWTLR